MRTARRRPWPIRLLVLGIAMSAAGGCALRPQTTSADGYCYTESGWMDASNGCSTRAGYPDCFLVCPEKGIRRRL